MVDAPIIKRIKNLQLLAYKQFNGIEINYVGRPGHESLNGGKLRHAKFDDYIESERSQLKLVYEGLKQM